MKIKNFNHFLNEKMSKSEKKGLYDKMSDLLNKANILVCTHDGDDPEEYEIPDPDTAIELLEEIDTVEAKELLDQIESLNNEIDETDSEEYY